MSDWVWGLIGGSVTLVAAATVVLWQAFKHLDDKIDRLGDKMDTKFNDQRNHFDKKFDQVMAGITEITRLVAGHDAQIKAHEKQLDRLPWTVSAPPLAVDPGQHDDVQYASEPTAPAEGTEASAGGPEPTPPTAAVAPA